MKTSAPLTKADEKALLADVIKGLPDGYVRDILSGVQLEINNAIDSDFGFITIGDRFKEIDEHRKNVETLRKTADILKNGIDELERKRTRLQDGIEELRGTVRQLARI